MVHVVVAGDIGGAERLLVDLASRHDRTGAAHEVAVITPNRALVSYFESAGLRVHDRGPSSAGPLSYLAQSLGPADVAWLAALLARHRADIVHTHTFASHVLGTRAARRAGLPQVRTEHHVMHYFDWSCSPFTRWAATRTDRLVAVSQYVRTMVAQTAPALAAKMGVVRNGVDTSYWAPRAAKGGGPFRVGIVGRLTGWKRVDLAIEATASANVELWVIGDGEDRPRLEGLARGSRAPVRFVGHQGDPRPLVAECDVILSTADREPLGLSVLEALSMARPVIAFAGGGIPEIVHDEVTGLLVTEATGTAFAAAIERLRGDRARAREMGAHGRRFAVEQGHIDRTCDGYAATYRALSRLP